MNSKIVLLPMLAAALVAATGCVTMGNMTTASALPAGESQFNLEPNLWGVAPGQDEATTDPEQEPEGPRFLLMPTFAVSGRYGVTDRFELGGRAGLGGFELLTKFQLTDPADDFVVSLAPSGGGFVLVGDGGGVGFLAFNLPLLFGLRSPAGELVLGPKVHDVVWFAGDAETGASLNLLSVGGTVGYAFRLGAMTLMPELAVLVPVYGSAGVSVSGDSGSISDFMHAEGVLLQFSFAMMFGG